MNYTALLNRQKQERYGKRLNKLPCQNNSGTNTIPSFGLVRVTGVNAQGVALVDQPNTDGQDVYVNGPLPIPASAYGAVSRDWPLFAAYDAASGTPAIGDTWGAAAGSYLLTKGKAGFTIQQNPGPGRVLIAPPLVPPGPTVTSQTRGPAQVGGTTSGSGPMGTITVTQAGLYLVWSNVVIDAVFSVAGWATMTIGVNTSAGQIYHGSQINFFKNLQSVGTGSELRSNQATHGYAFVTNPPVTFTLQAQWGTSTSSNSITAAPIVYPTSAWGVIGPIPGGVEV